jgi:hypothetical protein
MNSIKGFNPRRFLLLIRNDLFFNRSYFLISSGVVAGILLFFSTLARMNQVGPQFYPDFYQTAYSIILFLGGILITGKIFQRLHNNVKGSTWITLPASILEKFVSRLILLTVIFPIALTVLIFLISLIAVCIHVLFMSSSLGIFNPFDKNILSTITGYIVLQSPFLLGAIYFKKNSMAQTFLAIIGYLILLALIAHVFYIAIYSHYTDNFHELLNPNGIGLIQWIQGIFKHHSMPAYMIIYWGLTIFNWCIAPVCWVTGYFRLKEKEL